MSLVTFNNNFNKKLTPRKQKSVLSPLAKPFQPQHPLIKILTQPQTFPLFQYPASCIYNTITLLGIVAKLLGENLINIRIFGSTAYCPRGSDIDVKLIVKSTLNLPQLKHHLQLLLSLPTPTGWISPHFLRMKLIPNQDNPSMLVIGVNGLDLTFCHENSNIQDHLGLLDAKQIQIDPELISALANRAPSLFLPDAIKKIAKSGKSPPLPKDILTPQFLSNSKRFFELTPQILTAMISQTIQKKPFEEVYASGSKQECEAIKDCFCGEKILETSHAFPSFMRRMLTQSGQHCFLQPAAPFGFLVQYAKELTDLYLKAYGDPTRFEGEFIRFLHTTIYSHYPPSDRRSTEFLLMNIVNLRLFHQLCYVHDESILSICDRILVKFFLEFFHNWLVQNPLLPISPINDIAQFICKNPQLFSLSHNISEEFEQLKDPLKIIPIFLQKMAVLTTKDQLRLPMHKSLLENTKSYLAYLQIISSLNKNPENNLSVIEKSIQEKEKLNISTNNELWEFIIQNTLAFLEKYPSDKQKSLILLQLMDCIIQLPNKNSLTVKFLKKIINLCDNSTLQNDIIYKCHHHCRDAMNPWANPNLLKN